MSHSPEPWKVDTNQRISDNRDHICHIGLIIEDSVGDYVAASLSDRFTRSASAGTEDEVWANARRIVACVNACKGIPTEMLEKRRVRVIAGPPIRDGKRQQPEFYATGTIDDLKAIVQQLEADNPPNTH